MNNDNFDERQKILRLKVYRAMFFVLIGYLFFAGIFQDFLSTFADFMTIAMTGIALTACLGIAIMIFKECYVSRLQSKKSSLIGMTIMLAFSILYIILNIKTGIVTDGKLNLNYSMLCMGIFWLITSLSYFIKKLLDYLSSKKHCED